MNYSRAVGIARFVLVVLIITMVSTLAVCGFKTENFSIGGVFEEGTIVLGLDLQGGSIITFQAQPTEGETVTSAGMDSVLEAMRTRLDSAGLTEANCYLVGSDMIRIELPGDSNPTEAVKNFGGANKLTFRTYDSASGEYKNVVMTGDDVKSASAVMENDTGYWAVALSFTEAGAKKFFEATKAAAALKGESHNYMAIYLDDELLSNPTVDKEIDSNEATITQPSGMDREYAITLAGNINAGALQYDLVSKSVNSVGPTLGENSLSSSLRAGALGLLLVILFMIIVYRVPGAVSAISLVCYTALFALFLSFTGANLTLPGIAGIVLSIGMAVDANVVIFERMKEELRAGKTVKAAIKGGYSKAFSAILDSNITTLIAAGVLYFLGSGTIQGFAITLGLGVIISFFTALVVTRILLNLCVAMGVTKPSFYGFSEKVSKLGKFNVIKSKKIVLIISAVLVVAGIASMLIAGFNIDIDFSGGSEIKLDIGRVATEQDCKEINDIIANDIGKDYVSSTTIDINMNTLVIIRTGTAELTNDQQEKLLDALDKKFEIDHTESKNFEINSISAYIGDQLKQTAILSVLIAVIGMLIYIALRFRSIDSALAAIVCLIFNSFIMVAVYSIFKIPVDSNIIAALLTILGYSINATIVIFDRIRENRKAAEAGKPFTEIVAEGTSSTMGRSLNTTLTTLFTILMIFIFGVESIRDFAFPLIIGIISGLFSSVCLSGYLWTVFDKWFAPLKGKLKKKKA